ncbi:MAG: hypothetical protein AABZ12_11290 [Planctomycetota bacterium]
MTFRAFRPCVRTLLGAALAVLAGGCGEAFSNLTASLGGSTVGQRGDVRVLMVNNTPYRAVFTVGAYDSTDPDYRPFFDQVVLAEDGLILDGDSESRIGTIECARVFSLGGPTMLDLIRKNVPSEDFDASAMVEGVEFYQIDADDPSADPLLRGAAAPFEARLGVDFPCEALLIVYLEHDEQASPQFRVDFKLIPSQSSR